jgi:geranylgeranylglycerol-phosphate geranylgeranyltransferase
MDWANVGKARGLVLLIRPTNCAMMGLAVLIGVALASYAELGGSWQNLAYGFVTGFTLTAASMAINDYYDREIDAVNEPNRPIPSGAVGPKEALVFAFFLTATGFIAALLTNMPCLLTAMVAWMAFTAYTVAGKRSGLPGNFLVGLCVAMPFIYGSVVATSAVRSNVLVFALMAFLSNVGREITKGIVDVQGDRTQSVKTLAVRYGEKKAAVAGAVFYISAVLLSPIPWILGLVSFWFLPFVAVTDLGLITSSVQLLRNSSRENARRIKKAVLLWFLFGLLAFVAGAFP